METKPERTGERASEYSLWHRQLGSGCYAVDVDWVEYRFNRGIVAFICATSRFNSEQHLINSKPMVFARTELERKIVKQLSEVMKVPAFFVMHLTDLSLFHVYDLSSMTFKVMNKEEYGDFIKKL